MLMTENLSPGHIGLPDFEEPDADFPSPENLKSLFTAPGLTNPSDTEKFDFIKNTVAST